MSRPMHVSEHRTGVIPVPDPLSGANLAFDVPLQPLLARYVATV